MTGISFSIYFEGRLPNSEISFRLNGQTDKGYQVIAFDLTSLITSSNQWYNITLPKCGEDWGQFWNNTRFCVPIDPSMWDCLHERLHRVSGLHFFINDSIHSNTQTTQFKIFVDRLAITFNNTLSTNT